MTLLPSGKPKGLALPDMLTAQSFLRLPRNFELDLTLRYVSTLQFPVVDAYTTGDARLGLSSASTSGCRLPVATCFSLRTLSLLASRATDRNPQKRVRADHL